MAKVTLLHLTDLHFGMDADPVSAAQRTSALNSLLRTLADLPDGWRPQVICLTGDVGWKGATDDYTAASAWLSTLLSVLKLTPSDVVVCAGNHDVDRRVAERHARPTHPAKADKALAPPLSAVATYPAFSAYSAFCKEFGVRPYKLNEEESFLVGTTDLQGLCFVGCNTAWHCQGNDDQKKLWVGLPHLQILEANGKTPLTAGKSGPPTICLMHHPPDWWHDDETHATPGRPNTQDYLAHRCHLILSGHTHGEVRKADRIAQSSWHLTGGASYAGGNYCNTVRLIRVDQNALEHRSFEFDPRSPTHEWKSAGEAQRLPFVDRPPEASQVAGEDIAGSLAALHESVSQLSIRVARYTGQVPNGIPASYLEGGGPTSRSPGFSLSAFAGVDGSMPTINGNGVRVVPDPPPLLDPPALPPERSERTAVVDSILSSIGQAAWLHLHAGPQSGKSVLAQLVARRTSDTVVWIRCRDRDPAAFAVVLDRTCSALAGGPPPAVNRSAWYRGLFGQSGAAPVVVIDDLPDLAGGELDDRLIGLAQAGRAVGGRLITVGVRALPSTLPMSASEVWQGVAPPFSPAENAELLTVMGAPEPFVRQYGQSAHELNDRHPALLVTLGRQLRPVGWVCTPAEFAVFVAGRHDAELSQQFQRRIRQSVPDPNSRELLFRLAVSSGPFGGAQIDAVGEVREAISRPRDRLQEIADGWLTRGRDGRHDILPLLRHLAPQVLTRRVLHACHRALGRSLLRGSVNQNVALEAILHLQEGGDPAGALSAYLMVLGAVQRQPEAILVHPAINLWIQEPLTASTDLNLRLVVRALQIKARAAVGLDNEFLLADVDRLLNEASPEHAYGVIGACVNLIICFGATDCGRACGYLIRLFRTLRQPYAASNRRRPKSAPVSLPHPLGIPYHHLAEVCIPGIRVPADLARWLDAVGELDENHRGRVFQEVPGLVSATILADQLVSAELGKTSHTRDWPGILAALEDLERRGRALLLPDVPAAAVRARIIVLAEHCRRLDEAAREATSALPNTDSFGRYLITAMIGREFLIAKQYDEARRWLSVALDGPAARDSHDRMVTLLAAAQAFGPVEPDVAVARAAEAVALAERLQHDLEAFVEPVEGDAGLPAPLAFRYERVKALGELAIAQFLRGGWTDAYPAWKDTATELLRVRDGTAAWKDLAVLFGHVNSYLALMATTGNPPTVTIDGSSYLPPRQGHFLTEHPERASLYRVENEPGLFALLALYAEAAGDAAQAAEWRSNVVSSGAAVGDRLAEAVVADGEILAAVLADDVARALDLAESAARVLVAVHGRIPGGVAENPAAVPPLTPNQLSLAEHHTLTMGGIAVTLRIGTLCAADETRDAGRHVATAFVEACRSRSARLGGHRLWLRAAEAIERAFLREENYATLVDWRRSLDPFPDGFEDVLIRIALVHAASAKGAVALVLPTMPLLTQLYSPYSLGFRRLVAGYVEQFWADRLRRTRFQFRTPDLVVESFATARTVPEHQRPQAIYRAILLGISLRQPPEEIRRWLALDG